jgi:hypothetical protein
MDHTISLAIADRRRSLVSRMRLLQRGWRDRGDGLRIGAPHGLLLPSLAW